jgi:hypothetical protein
MKIVPTRIEEQINRVDRTPSLIIGICSAVVALWCVYSVFWGLYAAMMLSSVGWSPVSAVFSIVFWGVIGVIAVISAVGFLTHYNKGPDAKGPE